MKLQLDGTKRKVNAFVYIMHEDRKLGIPSQTYINTCRFGYGSFRFDFKYLDAAYEISKKGTSHEN